MTNIPEAVLISFKITQLKNMIETGYGKTGKPLPPNRLNKLKEQLVRLEYSHNNTQTTTPSLPGDNNKK